MTRLSLCQSALTAMLLCTTPTAPAHASDRLPVTSLKPLLLRAIDTGSAHGVIVGEAATFTKQRFDTGTPIEVDVRTVKSLNLPGCSRLEITTRQANVLDQGKRTDKRLAFQINYCRDGSLPATPLP